jgi:hypothetical protein
MTADAGQAGSSAVRLRMIAARRRIGGDEIIRLRRHGFEGSVNSTGTPARAGPENESVAISRERRWRPIKRGVAGSFEAEEEVICQRDARFLRLRRDADVLNAERAA